MECDGTVEQTIMSNQYAGRLSRDPALRSTVLPSNRVGTQRFLVMFTPQKQSAIIIRGCPKRHPSQAPSFVIAYN